MANTNAALVRTHEIRGRANRRVPIGGKRTLRRASETAPASATQPAKISVPINRALTEAAAPSKTVLARERVSCKDSAYLYTRR